MKFGRYEIIKELGRGSMGLVYQARDPMLDRLVAVKVLRREFSMESDFACRFFKEAKAIARLSHPGIVTIYDVENDSNNLYIAMEYLEGNPLSCLIHNHSIRIEDALRYGIQIAKSLDYAHRHGVIHRDIKPGNIIVTLDGTTHITDFGIARIEDDSMTLQTQVGAILGTPAYMSPEQALGKTVDYRSDIFSVGVMLYEMTVGKRPFGKEGKTTVNILAEIVTTTPKSPWELSASIPKDLSNLIMKAMEKDPKDRFPTGQALASELKKCLARMTKPPSKRRRVLWPILVLLTAILAASWGYFFYIQMPKTAVKTIKDVPAKTAESAKKQIVTHPVDPKSTVTSTDPKLPGKPAPPKSAPSSSIPQKTYREMVGPTDPPVPKNTETRATEFLQPQSETRPLGMTATPPVKKEAKPKRIIKPEPKPVPAPKKKAVHLVPVMLRSSPSGAQIYFDGHLKGTTPTTLMLTPGGHNVRARLSGYQDTQRRVTIPEIMEYPLVLRLQPKTQ